MIKKGYYYFEGFWFERGRGIEHACGHEHTTPLAAIRCGYKLGHKIYGIRLMRDGNLITDRTELQHIRARHAVSYDRMMAFMYDH